MAVCLAGNRATGLLSLLEAGGVTLFASAVTLLGFCGLLLEDNGGGRKPWLFSLFRAWAAAATAGMGAGVGAGDAGEEARPKSPLRHIILGRPRYLPPV